MSKLRFYPILNEYLSDESSLLLKNYDFYFNDEKEDILNDVEIQGKSQDVIILYDDRGYWDIRYYNLIVKNQISIKKPNVLFGIHGIAPSNAKIGVGFKWYSKDTKLRGFKELGIFDKNSGLVNIDFSYNFKKNFLRKELTLEILLYIADEDLNPTGPEKHLANIKGTVIGEVTSTKLILEGSRSEFPIVEIKDPNKPLWELRINWLTENDKFVDVVKLIINPSHPKFKEINMERKRYNQDLLDEIMISTIAMLFLKAKSDNIFTFGTEINEFEEGSVGAVLAYWVNIYALEDASIEVLHSKISNAVRTMEVEK